ncbi:MAG TPA: GIY-YIG nuclease family protein [Gammaproteobacteria bacterium]
MEAADLKTKLGSGKPGTYILCLHLKYSQNITIGKLGTFHFNKGYYYYVGSAFGPGGVAARCKHHFHISAKPRWHIDYLRQHCSLSAIYYNMKNRHLEHQWANTLQTVFTIPANRFGSSDCDCASHLFFSSTSVDLSRSINDLTLVPFQ